MATREKARNQNHLPQSSTAGEQSTNKEVTLRHPTLYSRLDELEALPPRNAFVHWAVFSLSLLSLILLSTWVFGSRGPVSIFWVLLDIALGVILAAEFLTRGGFRFYRYKYLRTHFFDFIAIVPALALINHGFPFEQIWVWLILVARFIRLIDRLLGDGFVSRNFLALAEGFEEEITDRVLDRIIVRIQSDIDKAGLSHKVAEALVRNKASILKRVRDATPREGLVPSVARIIGLDAALERAEERSFDALVGIVNSDEVERAVRDAINSSISSMRTEMGKRHWRQHLGIQLSQAKSTKGPRQET